MIAIIPARKGSKRLKDKNFKYLNKKPLIYWTIRAAKRSKLIKDVFISSDSNKLIKYASKFDVKNLGIRPNNLSKDNSKAIDVYLYEYQKILNKYKSNKDFVVLLPTSPLRNHKHIDEAIKVYRDLKVDSLISCKKLEKDISNWKFNLTSKKKIIKLSSLNKKKIMNNVKNLNSYIPNGAIYILNYDKIKKTKSYYFKKTYAYVMKDINSVDIDTEEDFEIAKNYLKKK